MRKNWWKVLCVILLSWALIAGLVVPMRPGVTSVTPLSAKVGDTVWLTVDGYNSTWGNATKGTAWLHIDELFKIEKNGKKVDSSNVFAIKSLNFKAINDRRVEFQFAIPATLCL